MASEAAVNEATQRITRVEQQLASMPERVVTQTVRYQSIFRRTSER